MKEKTQTSVTLRGGDKKRAKQRYTGLDIIKSCATFFVIAGHFFSLHTSFGSTIFEGVSMFLQAWITPLFYTGVPLFMIMTGYLNVNKTVNRKYYRGIGRVLVAYLFFSLLTLAFKKFYLMEDISLRNVMGQILRFNAVPYAWYIEMWIGLYLLTPFLNMLYKAIPIHKQKLLWLGILFVIIALPDLLNRYGFYLVPGFWQQCYPLMFFFIGSYIREYQPKMRSVYGWMLIMGCCLINPVFNLLFIRNHTLISIAGGSVGVFGTIIAVAFFLLLYQHDIRNSVIKTVFTKVSLLSLDIYLCCYIFDALYYPWFKEHYFVNQSQFGIFFFVIVPLVFVSSYVLAFFKESIFRVVRMERLWS